MKGNHRLKFFINAALILLAAFTIWYHRNSPLPTLEMEMHRMEETHLADRSTIIYTYRHPYMKDATNPYAIRNQEVLVGTTMDRIHVFFLERWGVEMTWGYGQLIIFPRNTGTATLIPLPETFIDYIPLNDGHTTSMQYARNLPHLLAVGPPGAATRARLTIDLSSRWEESALPALYTVDAKRDGDVFLFGLERKYQEGDPLYLAEAKAFTTLTHFQYSDLYGIPYTLEFFDKDGTLLETVTEQS